MALATASNAMLRRVHNRLWLQTPLRSLAGKLTLAFLVVGLFGAILVALLLGLRTRSEFDRFLSGRDQDELVAALTDYYAKHGSWDGAAAMLSSTPPLNQYSQGMVLTNASGVVVIGDERYAIGQRVTRIGPDTPLPIVINNQTVGVAYVAGRRAGPSRPPNGPPPLPPEGDFLQRVGWAAALSALVAALLALLVGVLLARTLTRPLRELTMATRAVARGELPARVQVTTRDEVGELAEAFNQMTADLARSRALRQQMTADLAHDLRTPLSILRGYTEGLQDGRIDGSAALFAVMHGEVAHLARLIEDLRVLSLADAGELPLAPRPVDPPALLERTVLAYMMQAEQQGIVLRLEASGDLPSVMVDTDRLAQVLNNLVSNALRYTQQGEIVLGATQIGNVVRLTIRDTGSGIDAADVPYVFDRFYRADKARQRANTSSSGLGLAIAKAIVEAHGGRLSVASTVGQGTTFTIELPLARSTHSHAFRIS